MPFIAEAAFQIAKGLNSFLSTLARLLNTKTATLQCRAKPALKLQAHSKAGTFKHCIISAILIYVTAIHIRIKRRKGRQMLSLLIWLLFHSISLCLGIF